MRIQADSGGSALPGFRVVDAGWYPVIADALRVSWNRYPSPIVVNHRRNTRTQQCRYRALGGVCATPPDLAIGAGPVLSERLSGELVVAHRRCLHDLAE